jgi:hypothetical protein
MGTLASVITAISDEVVAQLASGGYPALIDGKIVVGTAAEFEELAPPRIIFDPTPGFKFVTREYYSASTTIDTPERKVEVAQRTIAGRNTGFTVHCWGSSPTRDVTDDYDVTYELADRVRSACQKVMPGAFAIEAAGKFRAGTNITRLGRWLSFDLVIYVPVLSSPLPYDRARQYAPDNVAQNTLSDGMRFPDGTFEEGCVT